jgi:hypothetical protein
VVVAVWLIGGVEIMRRRAERQGRPKPPMPWATIAHALLSASAFRSPSTLPAKVRVGRIVGACATLGGG